MIPCTSTRKQYYQQSAILRPHKLIIVQDVRIGLCRLILRVWFDKVPIWLGEGNRPYNCTKICRSSKHDGKNSDITSWCSHFSSQLHRNETKRPTSPCIGAVSMMSLHHRVCFALLFSLLTLSDRLNNAT